MSLFFIIMGDPATQMTLHKELIHYADQVIGLTLDPDYGNLAVPNNGVVAIVYPRPSPIKEKRRTPNIQDHLSLRQFVPPLYYLYTFILVTIFPYCYFVYPIGSVCFGPGLACWPCSLAWAGLTYI